MILRNLTKEKFLVFLLITVSAFVTGNAAVLTGWNVFWLPILLLSLCGWVRFAERYCAEALIIIVIFCETLFFITDFGIRERFLSDIGIALMLPIIVLKFRRVWHHITLECSPYTIGIFLFFGAILVSLFFGSYLKFGQPMTIGMTVVRKYLMFCSYFFLIALGATREDCYRFYKYLCWVGASIACLLLLETILGGGVIFQNYYDVGQERAGKLRIHIGAFLIVFSVVYSFIKIQNLPQKSKLWWLYLILLGIDLFVIISIVMTRAIIWGLLVIFVFWLLRKISIRKIMISCAAVFFIGLFLLSGLGEQLLSKSFVGSIVEQTFFEMGADTGNVSIRKKGVQHYMSLLFKDAPLTGVGVFSDRYYPNNPITRAADLFHYYIVDINAVTTLVHFGIQGLVLLVFFTGKSLWDTFKNKRDNEATDKYNYEVLFYIFIYTLATPTLHNIIVERMLIYSGSFFYLLSLSNNQIFTKIKP